VWQEALAARRNEVPQAVGRVLVGVERDGEAPAPGDFDQGQPVDKLGLALRTGQGVALGLQEPEDRDCEETDCQGIALLHAAILIVRLGPRDPRGEDMKGVLALLNLPAERLPLAEASGIAVAVLDGDEAIRPTPVP
jgi:hypothetical protein